MQLQHVHPPLCSALLACADLEWRLQVQVLPLLVNLDQAAMAFLQHFFAPADEEEDEALAQGSGATTDQEPTSSEAAQETAGAPGDTCCKKCRQGSFQNVA